MSRLRRLRSCHTANSDEASYPNRICCMENCCSMHSMMHGRLSSSNCQPELLLLHHSPSQSPQYYFTWKGCRNWFRGAAHRPSREGQGGVGIDCNLLLGCERSLPES